MLDVPPELVEEINARIQSGKYRSPQDFIIAAIQNQVYIESSEPTEAAPGHSASKGYPASQASKSLRIAPELAILLLPPDVSKVRIASPGDAEAPGYLWGQYNRFLPVKIAVRVAANLISQHGSDSVSLSELQEKSAEIARLVGKQAEKMDRHYGRKRGTIISAGLPVGRDADKAKLRFKNQFVGYMISKVENGNGVNRTHGAAPVLKFLKMSKGGKNSVLVGITDFGLQFASRPNPVIDQGDFSSVALSHEEAEFLLEHIASEVPEEAKLMQLVLEGVKKGLTTPSELNERVQSHCSDWNDNEASLMRAGLISRIGELGLLERRKEGVKVTYLLTDLGEKYLERLGKREA